MAIINVRVGLKWSMIHFLGRITLALKGFSEKNFKLQTDTVNKYQIEKCSSGKYFLWSWFLWIVTTSLTYSYTFWYKFLENAAFQINVTVKYVWYLFRIIFWHLTLKVRTAESTASCYSLKKKALARACSCT